MSRSRQRPVRWAFAGLMALGGLTCGGSAPVAPDLTKDPTLYVVGYAHLDTEWRWDYQRTISEFLPKTMRDNFTLLDKYPNYVFNFSGANRYRMMKEYFPADYARVKEYVAGRRWFPSGSAMEESDVNVPSAESLIRQVLYGTEYFRREFGKTSAEYMLPDCFGFPASLPSILAHAGIAGFSTQKLTWHSAAPVGGEGSPEATPEGIPFNVGIWEGLDGRSVIAALNPGSYTGQITYDVSKPPPPPPPDARSQPTDWVARVQRNGAASGLLTDYHYYGTGDTGGAPREASIALLEAIVTKSPTVLPPAGGRGRRGEPPAEPAGPAVVVGDGPLHVVSATAEQMFLDLQPADRSRLPRYQGDLLLIEHSAGSLTSQAYVKGWNRRNEVLADAAERASVSAAWLGGRAYPRERLTDAWTLVMGAQFHDILPGTSIPKAYEYAWNDQVLAMNQFAGVITSATAAVASRLDTSAEGVPLIVFNPLDIAREDIVEADVAFPGGQPAGVRVFGPTGREAPAQISNGRVVFLARVPAVGYAVYDVRPAATAAVSSVLAVTPSSIENGRYRLLVDRNGDVAGLFDKKLDRELLSAPMRLAIKTDKPVDWPAWNMDWADQRADPRAYVAGPARIRIVERGPARVALEVSREAEGSRVVQTIRLAAGDAGNRVEFSNLVDWRTSEANLKATFPLAAANPVATYNWDIGTIRRGNNDEKKYEVPSHLWFDLTDAGGAFGVTVLSGSKYGSDKPDDRTLRLTLVRTPGIGTGNGRSYADQSTQDWGRHEFVYGVAGDGGDWRSAETDRQALRLDTPLMAFTTAAHDGSLGRLLSLMQIGTSRVRALAVKQAERSDEVVVRLVELDGRSASGVRVSFAAPVTAAREVNGQEQPVGDATVANGALVADFGPYQVRTFAVRLGSPAAVAVPPASKSVDLPYDRVVTSNDGASSAPGFDAEGGSLPAEMLPAEIPYAGVWFRLAAAGGPNAVVPAGQTIPLPEGRAGRLYLLAAADGDQTLRLRVGDRDVDLTIQDWGGYIGQWDNRTWRILEEEVPPRPDAPPGTPARKRTAMHYTGLTPGFVKRAPVAWFASHHHDAGGANVPYAYAYLYAYAVDLPEGVRTITLPANDRVRVLAATVSNEGPPVRPAHPLYDRLVR